MICVVAGQGGYSFISNWTDSVAMQESSVIVIYVARYCPSVDPVIIYLPFVLPFVLLHQNMQGGKLKRRAVAWN